MELTHESRRWRWTVMAAVWALCAAVILLHAVVVRDYLAILDQAGARNASIAPTPLRQVLPARYADAQMWVRHVLAADEAGVARLRETSVDNAPQGRDVHWSSGFAWLLRGAGKLQRAVTADGWPAALEHALLWFNTPLLFLLIVVMSTWAAREAGAGAGVLVACGMIGHRRFAEGFAPAYVDHHGLVTAAVFGLVLGVVFMGAGWWRAADGMSASRSLPTSCARARRAAIVSALCGAIGMWLSAAAVLPAIALLGAAGLALAWWQGPAGRRDGAVFEPGLWRLWGRVGAGASLACYLIEYAPRHLALRLEANHPLYSLAWWGGAELVALLAAWRVFGRAPRWSSWRDVVLPLVAIAAAPVAIAMGGTRVFMVGDPFVGDLRHFVAEGRTLAATVRQFGFGAVAYDLLSMLILVPAGLIFLRARSTDRLLPGAMIVVAAGFAVMGLAEMRWWVTGSAAQLGLLVTLFAAVSWRSPRARGVAIAGVALVLLVAPAIGRIMRAAGENRRHAVAEGDLLQPLYRDLAATLRASQPEGEIVLLASPNASAGIGYFGRFKSLGTLFWENAPGLRAAAEIFAATSDDDALRLLQARGVTHIAMIAKANFVGEYVRLLHPRATERELAPSFGHRLLVEAGDLPRWLQPIAYRKPPELAAAGGAVALYKVAPHQTELERLFTTGVAEVARGEIEAAEESFVRALAGLPAQERAAFCEAAGSACYEFGADAAAVRWFRRALELGHDSGLATTTAWILATSADAALRDGRAAVALVEPLSRTAAGDPTVLSALAAAYAETQRFPEAVRIAEQALARVRASGDGESALVLEKRLEAYRAGRPWRQ